MESTTRKPATPARTSRIAMPAPRALPANSRSPSRRTARGARVWGALVVVTGGPSVCRIEGWWGDGTGPGRRTARDVRRRLGPVACGPTSSGDGDRVDRLLGLFPQRVGDRCRARGVRGSGLAFLADHVTLEGLDQVGGGLLVVLDAADVVADQDDRVLVGRRRLAVDVVGEVVVATPGLDLRALDDLGGRRGRRCDEVRTDADLGDARTGRLV